MKSVARGIDPEDIMPGISYFLVNGKNKKCSAPIGHLCSCKRHILYRKMLWNGIYGQRCTVKMGFKPVCIFYGFARAWCRSKMA